MSTETLQQVIEEIKVRGVREGEREGERIVEEARKEAAGIVEEARAEAGRIVEEARAEAEALRTQLDAELRQACSVGLEAFRQAVEDSLLVPRVDESLRNVLRDPSRLTEILVATVRGFTEHGGVTGDLTVLLPESMRQELESSVAVELKTASAGGVDVRFDEGLEFGFRLAPEGTGYLFDFSDEGFREIFLKFIAPRFRDFFFAGK